MKAFSIIELLVALGIMTMTLTAISLAIFNLPRTIEDTSLKAGAIAVARAGLQEAIASSSTQTTLPFSTSSSTGPYTTTLRIEEGEDISVSSIQEMVSWQNLFSTPQSLSLRTIIANPTSLHPACDPFVSGDWKHPVLRTSTKILKGRVAALAATQNLLVAALESTVTSADSTLLFYSAHGTSSPFLISGIDNAPTSHIGFSSITIGGDTVFAASAFASGSAETCEKSSACAQVQAYSLPTAGNVSERGGITLSTSTPPYALKTNNIPAAATAVIYDHGTLYVGLQKTVSGDEFNIIDAHDPSHLTWRSGLRIGRTVNDIQIRDGYAYVSSDNPSRELTVIDVRNPSQPFLAGTWNGPSGETFGYGTASTVHAGVVRFGRTYSNAAEFELLDTHDLSHITEAQPHDLGTARSPQSVRDLLTQDWMTFVLLSNRLEFWNTADTYHALVFASPYLLPAGSSGTALTCQNNILYIGINLQDGTGTIQALSGR